MKKPITLTRSIQMLLIGLFASALMMNSQNSFAQTPYFGTSGGLVVLQEGDGVEIFSAGTGLTMYLKQYSTTGTLVKSLKIPDQGSNALIMGGGNTGTEGNITLTADGQNIVIGGYNTPQPYSSVISSATAAAVPRAVGNVDLFGNYTLACVSTSAFSAGNIRGAISDGGDNFWAVGSVTGPSYMGVGPAAVPLTTIPTKSTNDRGINTSSGNIYLPGMANPLSGGSPRAFFSSASATGPGDGIHVVVGLATNTVTVTAASTTSTTVTGSGFVTSGLAIGSLLTVTGTYSAIGVVSSITNDNTLILQNNSASAIAASTTVYAVSGYEPINGNTSVIKILPTAANYNPYNFAISPDGKTIFIADANSFGATSLTYGSAQATAESGTLTVNGTAVTGVGTTFSTSLTTGSIVFSSTGAYIGVIATLTSATAMTLTSPVPAGVFSGVGYTYLPIVNGTSAGKGGGIEKWIWNSTILQYAYDYTIAAASGTITAGTFGAYGINVDWTSYVGDGTNNNGALIYATTYNTTTGIPANNIIKVADNGTSPTVTTLATAPANTSFRGILPVPVQGAHLAASPEVLTGFSEGTALTPSAEQTFVVSGYGLSHNITVAPPASGDYWISTTPGGEANSSITLTPAQLPATIYVVLNSATNGVHNNEAIAVTDAGDAAVATNVWFNGLTGAIAVTSSLTPLTYTLGNGPSAAQSFTVSGQSLTSANLTLTPTANYQLSTTSATTGFAAAGTAINLTVSGGNVASTTVWVRLISGLSAGDYSTSANITFTATNASGAVSSTLGLVGRVFTGAFTSGNVVVNVMGDGVTTLSTNAAPLSEQEFNTTGTAQYPLNSFSLPNAGTLPVSAPYNVTGSGTATTEGYTKTSSDGTILVVPGFNAISGTTAVTATASTANGRTIGTIAQNGTVSSTNNLNIESANDSRSFASNGFSFWNGGAGGIYYVPNATSTTGTQLTSSIVRSMGIYNGTLYYVAANTNNIGVFQLGTTGVLPLTATPAPAQTLITDAAYQTSGNSPVDFTISPDGTTLYFTDDASYVNSSTEAGGIIKYTNTGSGWTYQYTISAGGSNKGAYGITANWSGYNSGTQMGAVIYATTSESPARLLQITDNGATSGSSAVTLTTATNADYTFRGVSFAPVANASATLFSTAQSLAFGGVPYPGGYMSAQTAFNVSGYNLGSNTVTVTPPAGYALSTTSGGPYSYTSGSPLTISPVSGSVNTTVYAVLIPTSVSTFNGNIALTCTGATTVNVPVTGSGIGLVNYYTSSAGGDLTQLATWGTNTDGSGAHPSNFTTPGQIFNIVNVSTETLTSAWAVSGLIAKVVVGNGTIATNFTVPSGFSYTGTVDVQASSTLTLQNATIPTLGILNAASTVVFNVTGGATIPSTTYGNLTVLGSNPSTDVSSFSTSSSASPSLIVNGNFVVNSATILGAGISPYTTLQLAGNLTGSNGAVINGAQPSTSLTIFSLVTSGNGSQTFSYPGGTIQLAQLTSTKSAGAFTLDNNTTLTTYNTNSSNPTSTWTYSGTAALVTNAGSSINATAGNGTLNFIFTGTATFTLGGNINTDDASAGIPECIVQLNFGTGTTFSDNSASVWTLAWDLGMTGAGTYNLNGTIAPVASCYIYGSSTTSPLVASLNNLSISVGTLEFWPANSGTPSTFVVKGNLSISGTGVLNIQGNTLQIGGNFSDSRTVDAISNNTNNTFVFNGTAAQTFSNSYTAGESFNNLTINNSNGVNFVGSSSIDIITPGAITLTNGILNTSTGKVTLGINSTISETAASYVLGKVTSTRTLAMNTNQAFGGMGLQIDAISAAPGSTTVSRITGTSLSIGCAGTSVETLFDVTPATNTGLNATVVYTYIDNATLLNGYAESELGLFTQLGAGAWTLDATATSLANSFTATGVNVLGNYTASSSTPKGGTAVAAGGTTANPNTVICSGTGTTLTLSGYNGSVAWQSSADGLNSWTSISGATNATYNTGNLTTTTYYRALVTNPCFNISSNTVEVQISATPVVTLTNLTPTSVSAAFTPYQTNTGVTYSLTYSGSAGSGTINPAGSPQAINGLTSGSTLNVTVTQVAPAGCSVSGNASINTQLAAPMLTLSAATNTGFTASWTSVPGATSYQLFYKTTAGGTNYSTVVTSSTTVAITKLYPGDTYLAYVVPIETGYTGTQSTEQYITTLPNSSPCAIPTISAVSNCPNQITVTLSGSPGLYRLTLSRMSPNPTSGATYNVSGGTINITLGVQYASSIWQVVVSSNCGNGSFSTIASPVYVIIKAACPALQNLVLSTPTCLGFEATWNANNCSGSLVDYYLYVQHSGSLSYNAYNVGTNNYVDANWLAASTWKAYVVSVACNGAVSGASTIQTITTGVGCRTENTDEVDNNSADNTVEQGNASMNIYPNPTSGNFMVNVFTKEKADETVQIEMVNTVGQVVYTVIAPVNNGISNNVFQVPGNVASGMYLIRTVAGGESMTKQIIYNR